MVCVRDGAPDAEQETLMTIIDKQAREERRRSQREGMEALEASGALDALYAMIDAGEVRLEG